MLQVPPRKRLGRLLVMLAPSVQSLLNLVLCHVLPVKLGPLLVRPDSQAVMRVLREPLNLNQEPQLVCLVLQDLPLMQLDL